MSSPENGPLAPIEKAELTALIDENEGVSRTLRCRTVVRGAFRQEHYVRDLPPFGAGWQDRDGLLGEDTAPTPSEALLAALGSCLVIGIHANAVARAIPISKLELILTSEMNFGALWGTGNLQSAPIGLENIGIEALIGSGAPRNVLQALLDHVLLWSPVANSLHNPITLSAMVEVA